MLSSLSAQKSISSHSRSRNPEFRARAPEPPLLLIARSRSRSRRATAPETVRSCPKIPKLAPHPSSAAWHPRRAPKALDGMRLNRTSDCPPPSANPSPPPPAPAKSTAGSPPPAPSCTRAWSSRWTRPSPTCPGRSASPPCSCSLAGATGNGEFQPKNCQIGTAHTSANSGTRARAPGTRARPPKPLTDVELAARSSARARAVLHF